MISAAKNARTIRQSGRKVCDTWNMCSRLLRARTCVRRSAGSLNTTRVPAAEPSGGGADARHPLGRVLQLARRGHLLRRPPHARQALAALPLYADADKAH